MGHSHRTIRKLPVNKKDSERKTPPDKEDRDNLRPPSPVLVAEALRRVRAHRRPLLRDVCFGLGTCDKHTQRNRVSGEQLSCTSSADGDNTESAGSSTVHSLDSLIKERESGLKERVGVSTP